ncbi:MAG: YggS family pyridoxal phosphate-dependent enzyme [Bacteroidetes bacterium]|nr:YggS family pyridoxal phosphate-dependent enzyme [Bacteroidota bacterium]
MIKDLQDKISKAGATLVTVSKTHPPEKILAVYRQNCRDFGENKVQEMVDKHQALPKDIRWHLIGHLQTNKVKYIAPFVHLIHSVDSLRLLQEIEKQAVKAQRVISCLLQFHIAQEESKSGLTLAEACSLLEDASFKTLKHVQICGVMGMATFTEDQQQIRQEFRNLKNTFEYLKSNYFPDQSEFRQISMGMSGDWEIALEEGSTMVRIGSLIFGART